MNGLKGGGGGAKRGLGEGLAGMYGGGHQQQQQLQQQQQKSLHKKRRSDDASYASQKTTLLPPELDTSAPTPSYEFHKAAEDDRTPLGSPATPANLQLPGGLAGAAGGDNPPPPPPPPPHLPPAGGHHLAMMQQQQQLLQNAGNASSGTSAKPYACTKCTRAFATRQGHQSHMQNAHINKKSYECPQCSKKFSANGSLKRHIDTVHKRKRDFQCTRCGKLFALKHHLKNHMITVHHDKNVDLSNVKPINRRQTPSPQLHAQNQLHPHASPQFSNISLGAPLAHPPRQERRESSYSVSSFGGLSAPLFGMLTGNAGAAAPAGMSSLFDMGMLGNNSALSGAHHDDHAGSSQHHYDPSAAADFRSLLGSMNYGAATVPEEDHVQSALSSLTSAGFNASDEGFSNLMSYSRDSAHRRTSVFEGVPVVPFNTHLGAFNSDKAFGGMAPIPSMSSSSSGGAHH